MSAAAMESPTLTRSSPPPGRPPPAAACASPDDPPAVWHAQRREKGVPGVLLDAVVGPIRTWCGASGPAVLATSFDRWVTCRACIDARAASFAPLPVSAHPSHGVA